MKRENLNGPESKAENFSEEEIAVLKKVFNNKKWLSKQEPAHGDGLYKTYGDEFSREELLSARDYLNGKISRESHDVFSRFAPYARNILRALQSVTEEQFFSPTRTTGEKNTRTVPTRRTPPNLDYLEGK